VPCVGRLLLVSGDLHSFGSGVAAAAAVAVNRASGYKEQMADKQIEPCPGCGLVAGPDDGPTHVYIGSSPGCWAMFNELMTVGAGDGVASQLAGDAYAVQHPGLIERRAIQSVCVHAINLCARLERGRPEKTIQDLMRAALEHQDWWRPFHLRTPIGSITVADVLAEQDLEARAALTRAWATDIWAACEQHHELVRGWLDELTEPAGRRREQSGQQHSPGRQHGVNSRRRKSR